MIRHTIEALEDPHNPDQIGRVLKELHRFEDSPFIDINGIGIAHDIVEHVNGVSNIGSIEDELQALAGIWLTRGQFDDMMRPNESIYHPSYHIASEMLNLYLAWGVIDFRPLKYTR